MEPAEENLNGYGIRPFRRKNHKLTHMMRTSNRSVAAVHTIWLHCHLIIWIIVIISICSPSVPVMAEVIFRIDPLGEYILL